MITLQEYTQKLQELHALFNHNLSTEIMDQLSAQYALVSASVHNFLPAIPVSNHPYLYNQVLLHQKISILDETAPWAMENLEYDTTQNFDISTFQNKAAVFCTMHMGSYRLINFLLKQYRIPYVLIAGKNVIQAAKDQFEQHYNNYPVQGGYPLSIIDAEHPSSAIMMFRALKQGKSLLLYLDGNTGAGNAAPGSSNSCAVHFLAQQLNVRCGAAYLAIKANAPLVPVLSYKPSMLTNRIRVFDPVYPTRCEQGIKHTMQLLMQQVYSAFQTIIRLYPGQWEAWLYLHKSAKIIQRNPVPQTAITHGEYVNFNWTEFAIFNIDNHFFLLRKNTYTSFPIDGKLYDFLSYCLPSHIKNIALENVLLDELLSERIVIKCSTVK